MGSGANAPELYEVKVKALLDRAEDPRELLDHEPTEELRRELVAFARRRLASMAPKEIDFDQDLPLTQSGKVMRRLLKAREIGGEAGDVSTLGSTR